MKNFIKNQKALILALSLFLFLCSIALIDFHIRLGKINKTMEPNKNYEINVYTKDGAQCKVVLIDTLNFKRELKEEIVKYVASITVDSLYYVGVGILSEMSNKSCDNSYVEIPTEIRNRCRTIDEEKYRTLMIKMDSEREKLNKILKSQN